MEVIDITSSIEGDISEVIEEISLNSSDADDESDGVSWIRNVKKKKTKKKPYGFHGRRIVPAAYRLSDIAFKKTFRMSKVLFELLLTEVGDDIPLGFSTNGKSITPRCEISGFWLLSFS